MSPLTLYDLHKKYCEEADLFYLDNFYVSRKSFIDHYMLLSSRLSLTDKLGLSTNFPRHNEGLARRASFAGGALIETG